MQVHRKLSFLFVCLVGLPDTLKLQSQLVQRTLRIVKPSTPDETSVSRFKSSIGINVILHLTFYCSIVRWQKMALLVFAKGRLVCRAKPNVPFVRQAKIVFKKCGVGKNKNTEALAFGSAVCRFNCPVTC